MHQQLRLLVIGLLLAFARIAFCQELIAPRPAPIPSSTGKVFTSPPHIPPPPSDLIYHDIFDSQVASETYSLEELLALAANNNPTLRQARTHISAELGKALQAGLYPNPVFSYQAEQIGVDAPNGTNSPGEFQGGVIEQRFVTGGKLRISREKYLRRARVSENLAMAPKFRVCNDVRIHFYKTLPAGEILSLRREMVKTAEDVAVTSQESYNVGQSNRPQVRRANVALQRARLEVLSAENAYNEEFRKLSSLVGIALAIGSVEGELRTKCPPLSFEEAYSRILAESPELAAARAKLSVDQATVARENVQWVPDIVVHGGAGYNFEAEETTAVAGVAFEVPLYDRNQGTVRQAQADYARQRQEIERVELELHNRLAMIYQQYLTGLQHASEYEQVILPELQAAYGELLESYEERRVDWPDVLVAQHDYFDAKLTQVDNLLHARTQEVLIYGYLLHDGLKAAPGITPPGHIDSVPKPR